MSAESGASAGHSRRLESLEEMRRDIDQVSATATRPDGLITVVVGSRGHVQDIRFDPRVYRKLDTGELSRAIMQLISEATADVTGQLREIVTPFAPEGDGPPGAEADFAAYLPQPPVSPGEPT